MKKILIASIIVLYTGITQAALIPLSAQLRAPNQNGSNPDIFTTQDRVPSDASGTFSAILDTENKELTNIVLNVEGMVEGDLKNFGPNSTPFHLHIPNNGPGTFGFNVVDLVFGADASAFTFTSTGFSFVRDSVSVLEEDQGNFFGLGIHPGNDVIIDRLLEESFVLVHSNKNIFTNTIHPPQFPDGFPFGELRGEIKAVPLPAAIWLFGSALIGLSVFRKNK